MNTNAVRKLLDLIDTGSGIDMLTVFADGSMVVGGPGAPNFLSDHGAKTDGWYSCNPTQRHWTMTIDGCEVVAHERRVVVEPSVVDSDADKSDADESIADEVPPLEDLRYEGQPVRWDDDALLPAGTSDFNRRLGTAYERGTWYAYESTASWAGSVGSGESADMSVARRDAESALFRAGVLTRAEPVTPSLPAYGGYTDWIQWSGGERPVPQETLVHVVFRGVESAMLCGIAKPARYWEWQHGLAQGNIIAYRVVKE